MSKAFSASVGWLKGHCNRLQAIFELPVHQREAPVGGFFLLVLEMGVSLGKSSHSHGAVTDCVGYTDDCLCG